jgi:hypothetical protein
VVAFEGDRLWGNAFERLNDGELVGRCPSCESDLYFVIGQYGFFCCAGDWVPDGAVTRMEIHAKKPGELAEPGQRLFALSSRSGDAELGDWICRLFGTSTCPTCGQSVDLPMVIAAFEAPADTA